MIRLLSKFNLFLLAFSTIFLFSCGDDDSDGGGPTPGEALIRIVEVDPDAGTYTFENFGDASADISGYRLCSKFNYSGGLSTLTLVSGSLDLAAGAQVTISGFGTDESADLGLYLASGGFDDPDAMVDFVQWGSAGNGRESVAMTKGIWTAGDFIDGIAPYEYTGTGSQNGITAWIATGTPPPATPDVRIVKVIPGTDTYEFMNFGSSMVDISDYILCSKFDYSDELSTLTVEDGNLALMPGLTVTVSGFAIDDINADFGLYLPGTTDFAVADQMVDFMQYGSAANGRESVAVEAGLWSAGDFIPFSDYYEYTGNGTQNGLTFWDDKSFAGPNIRLVMVDPATDTYVIKNFGDQSLDISSYRLCSEFTYQQTLTTLTVNSGSLDLEPDAEVSLSGFAIDDVAADFGLYVDGSFGSSDSMVDFIQWGSGGNGRESVADTKGIWTAGDFLNGAGPFEYTGDGTQNGLSFWQ